MNRTHIAAMVGLVLSPTQRLYSLVLLLGSASLLSLSPSLYRNPDLGMQAVMLLLVAVLLVQWRACLFEPSGGVLDLPIPIRRNRVLWVIAVLQVLAVGAVSLILRAGWVYAVGHDLAATQAAFIDHIVIDVIADMLLLLPILMLVGRFMSGTSGHREVLIWAAGPALGALSVACMALNLPWAVVYTLWLGVVVALIVAVVLIIGRLVGKLRTWRENAEPEGMGLSRDGMDAQHRLGSDGRTGIRRAIGWLIASDVLGWCLLWFAFSSWMFHDIGLDAQQAQNLVAPLGLAVLLGVRVMALGSLMGQVGLLAGFQPWSRQPWLLLPLSRTTIQRALLRHIGIVALVAIGLNIAFLSAWAGATDELMWSPQHVQLRGLIASMVQSMAIVTAIMAMAFMVVGTGLRGAILLTCVAAGSALSILVYVDNMPVPGLAAAYVSTAVANTAAVAVLMAMVWAISWHRAGKAA